MTALAIIQLVTQILAALAPIIAELPAHTIVHPGLVPDKVKAQVAQLNAHING